MKIENEFIPFEQALALKELGFDEQCLALYDLDGKITIEFVNWKNAKNRKSNYLIATPLYQQAFRWFREKYNIECYVNCYWNEVDSSKRDYYANYNYGSDIFYSIDIGFKNYKEAELECLKKLIEICKDENIRKSP